ncbi:MAG: hypothetical protein COV66_00450 [Nitrospinae bacterium CG11_big_fil_rev_8_21_14_0_20_45_15]|nr:MAG: hypothetical protein COV66_00450 [Nitrospinae bacterium CG11_big_fil_rev_8_21_14_0_20_45_15]
MKLDFSADARKYLEQKRQSCLTVDLEEIQSPCCIGRLPEIKFSNSVPAKPEDYRSFSSFGIEVFISKLLRTSSNVTFSLSGFGPFKKLEIQGIDLIL